MYAYVHARRGVMLNVALIEPFGLTVLEAAACGVPVVVTNNGGAYTTTSRVSA